MSAPFIDLEQIAFENALEWCTLKHEGASVKRGTTPCITLIYMNAPAWKNYINSGQPRHDLNFEKKSTCADIIQPVTIIYLLLKNWRSALSTAEAADSI
jgi:hypothetical protein